MVVDDTVVKYTLFDWRKLLPGIFDKSSVL
jgi:hypothetical protein